MSANKSATHFPILRELTRVRYDRMLFFDGKVSCFMCAYDVYLFVCVMCIGFVHMICVLCIDIDDNTT